MSLLTKNHQLDLIDSAVTKGARRESIPSINVQLGKGVRAIRTCALILLLMRLGGNPVRVASQIPQHMCESSERRLGVDHLLCSTRE
jgi:hypothetical protein